jgi:hypothetical protein
MKMAVFWVAVDDEGSKHLRNVGKLLPDYTAQQPRRQPSSKYYLLRTFSVYQNRNQNSFSYFENEACGWTTDMAFHISGLFYVFFPKETHFM